MNIEEYQRAFLELSERMQSSSSLDSKKYLLENLILKNKLNSIQIYKENLMGSLIKVLKTTYPWCEVYLGRVEFLEIAHKYARVYAKEFIELKDFGRYFLEFWDQYYFSKKDYRFIRELIEFEYMTYSVLSLSGKKGLDLSEFNEFCQTKGDGFVLRRIPSLMIFKAHFTFLSIIGEEEYNKEKLVSILKSKLKTPELCLVWRHKKQIISLRVDAQFLDGFLLLQKPSSLIQLEEQLLEKWSEEDLREFFGILLAYLLVEAVL